MGGKGGQDKGYLGKEPFEDSSWVSSGDKDTAQKIGTEDIQEKKGCRNLARVRENIHVSKPET